MSDVHQKSSGSGDAFDLKQFYPIFFEEAGENLDQMEQMLLNLNLEEANDEQMNGIFRCAHSVKGGAATFGFSDVTALTHQMESLLDRWRRHELKPHTMMVDVLLESADASRVLLARHQSGETGDPPSSEDLVRRISELASGQVPSNTPVPLAPPAVVVPGALAATPAVKGARQLEITIDPRGRMDQADAVKELFRDIVGLGKIIELPCKHAGLRVFKVVTSSSNDDLLDLFAFNVSREQVMIKDLAEFDGAVEVAATVANRDRFADDLHQGTPLVPAPGYGFFDDASGVPSTSGEMKMALALKSPAKEGGKVASQAAQQENATIRVAINKVDQLINLVGELVITQAMLAQNTRNLDLSNSQQLLAELDRNTRDLQESVMSIRMMPMSIVFSRFPRMLRDLASKLGKRVDFVTLGEATELDKSLVEKIADPLTHLVRNSCDHGIEMPEERVKNGKSEAGTITLSAAHQGGSIVIEVRDDGRGMSREKILKKARERGLDVSDQMSDGEVWQLIFAPGFSTAELVTDVSGRGVGMDVVKRNISDLNGTVEIESFEGRGMKVSVRLPLTLAIMDGMSLGVGNEVYILPLSSVIESFQIKENAINTVGQGAQLVKVRDEYMPVIELEKIFQVPRFGLNKPGDIMVVVEADGGRVALLVDELLGQQQVVVKNLETNYQKVQNISGATILGDGKVALILDTGALVRRSRH